MWDVIVENQPKERMYQLTAKVMLAGRMRTVRETLPAFDEHAARARFQRRYSDIRGSITVEHVD
jgi:hypothetical protein